MENILYNYYLKSQKNKLYLTIINNKNNYNNNKKYKYEGKETKEEDVYIKERKLLSLQFKRVEAKKQELTTFIKTFY